MLGSLLRLARPHQYVKNAFVLAGPLFGGAGFEIGLKIILAVCCFSAMASAVYVVNDIFDAAADRAHPKKCNRPIASGAISVVTARWFAACLALISVYLASLVGLAAIVIIVAYALTQVGYSIAWKHVIIVDVFLISAGFMLRILMGTTGLGISPSAWLLLCGLMVTLFLGFAKRYSELMQMGDLSTRKVLDDYSPAMIEQFTAISAACTIMSYTLYTVSRETISVHGTSYLIATVPFVIYGIFRYLYLLHCQQYGGDASREIFQDRHLLITAIGWTLSVVVILALRP